MCNYARRLIQGRLNKLIKVQIVLASTSARLLRPTCGQLPNWSWLAGDGGSGGAALHQPGVAIGGAGGGRALLSRDKGNLEHKIHCSLHTHSHFHVTAGKKPRGSGDRGQADLTLLCPKHSSSPPSADACGQDARLLSPASPLEVLLGSQANITTSASVLTDIVQEHAPDIS